MNEIPFQMNEKFLNKSACRLCFQDNSNMTNIQAKQNDRVIRETIFYCTNVNLIKNEIFSEIICSQCLLDLNTAFEFKKRCEESVKILNSCIQSGVDIDVSSAQLTELKIDSNEHSETVSDDDIVSIINSPLDNQEKTELALASDEKSVNDKTNENKIVPALHGENINKSELKVKLNKKNGNNAHNCNICKAKCMSKWMLTVHMRTHTGQKQFQCDICLKRFVSNSNMRMHKRLTHEDDKQVCSECGKSFNSLTYLKRHLVVHLAVKPYGCTICQHRFTTKSYLKEHIARHRGDKRFFCEVCGGKFVSDVNLKQHMLVHGIGKKDFKKHGCTFCAYRTTGRVDLERHVRTHTGERPFRCSHQDCAAAFAGKAALKLHSRIHTGEKPYSCSKCPAQFSRSDKFKNHLLKKHNIVNSGSDKRSRLIIKELAETATTDETIPSLMDIIKV